MARNSYFQFKQFRIVQRQSAMKVGTDGVLLGAWADTGQAKTILDIGTGTGVIALMMAQRSDAKITGVEIEKSAAEEAAENVRNSPWSERIAIENISFQEFAGKYTGKFDLIVTNPPFFVNSRKSKSSLLAMAKHNYLLPSNDLLKGVAKLLNKDSLFSVILPVAEAEDFIEAAKSENLFLSRLTKVSPHENKNPNRYLMEFTEYKKMPGIDTLFIRNAESDEFTQQYKKLTSAFYFNF